jgi:hypothetical protein
MVEDEMYMLFLCPFYKAAWFCSPWYLKAEFLAAHQTTIGRTGLCLPRFNPTLPSIKQPSLTSTGVQM